MTSQSSYTFIAEVFGLGEKGEGEFINILLPTLFSESQDSPLEKMGEVVCRLNNDIPTSPFFSGGIIN